MATAADILKTKGSRVQSVPPDATVLAAALLMNQFKIGSLLVMEGEEIRGIFTERDILQRVVVPRLDSSLTLVRDVMSTEVACCKPYTRLEEARGVMKNRRIRHLPVLDDAGHLLGLISIGDLNAYEAHDHEVTIHVMEEYIHGRV
jgi:CBS domain-containing protein